MDKPLLTDRSDLQDLAEHYHIRPSKDRSQNFLVDAAVLGDAVAAAAIQPGERVLEVGAGFGVLTEALLKSGAEVWAFEIDHMLIRALEDRFRGRERLTILPADFFLWYQDHAAKLQERSFRIIANLPYHASSFFFETVLAGAQQPTSILVLLQKEVAERIAAPAGKMSVLSLSVQYFGTPRVVRDVPRSSFWPVPDVDSALLEVAHIHPGGPASVDLFRFARMAFAGRRKQLKNSLAAGLHMQSGDVARLLIEANVDPNVRPQELDVATWMRLTETLKSRAVFDTSAH